jgi:hypothetical protein
VSNGNTQPRDECGAAFLFIIQIAQMLANFSAFGAVFDLAFLFGGEFFFFVAP